MIKVLAAAGALTIALTGLSAGVSAQTQTRHRAHVRALPHVNAVAVSNDVESIPLTVNRRSWLDPGNATRTTGNYGAPYVQENTIVSSTAFNETQDRIFAPGKFGNSVIVGPPDVPGRSQPVAQGSSLPDGRIVVDNALFPQNFYLNPAPALP